MKEFELNLRTWKLPFAVLVLSWVPGDTKLCSRICLVRLGHIDVAILSKVGNEIVHWVGLFWGRSPGQERLSLGLGIKLNLEVIFLWKVPLAVNLFFILEILDRVDNVSVNAEVWNEVILGVIRTGLVWEVPLSVSLFSECQTVLGLRDFFRLTEMRHKVVSLGWLLLWQFQLVVMHLLTELDVRQRFVDFIVGAKVWDEVVPWRVFWWILHLPEVT